MGDIYEKIEQYHLSEERKILIRFDDIIANLFNNKTLPPKVTELFIRDRELNVFLVFII